MLLTFLTSRKTTFLAVLGSLALLFFDAAFIAQLHDAGVSAALTTKLVALAKIGSLLLAALGYSPLKRPDSPAATPTSAG